MNRTELPGCDIHNHCGLLGHLQCGFGQSITFQKILHADAQITMAKSVNEEVQYGVELIDNVSVGNENVVVSACHVWLHENFHHQWDAVEEKCANTTNS
jgi:hypothetical protein